MVKFNKAIALWPDTETLFSSIRLKLVSSLLMITTHIIIARELTVELFATWGLLVGFFTLASSFSSLNIQEGATKAITRVNIKYGGDFHLYAFVVTSSTLVSFVSKAVLIMPILYFYHDIVAFADYGMAPEFQYVKMYILVFIVSSFLTPVFQVVLRDQGRVSLIFTVSIILAALKFFLVLSSVYFYTLSLEVLIFVYFLVGLIETIVIGFLIVRTMGMIRRDKIQHCKKSEAFPELIAILRKYFIHNYLFTVMSGLVKNTDVLIIGKFLTTSDVANYSLAKSLASAIFFLRQPVTVVIRKNISDYLESGAVNDLRKYIHGFMLLGVIPLVLVNALSFIFSSYFFDLLYDGKYSSADYVFDMLLFGYSVALYLSWSGVTIVASGRLNIFLFVNALTNGVFYLLNMGAVYWFGLVGISISIMTYWILISFVNLVIVRGVLKKGETS